MAATNYIYGSIRRNALYLPALIAIMALSVLQTAFGNDSKAKFEPPDGKIILIVGQDNRTILNYIDSVGIVPAGFMTYTFIGWNMEGLDRDSPDQGAGVMNADKLLKSYPGAILQIGLNMVGELRNAYTGRDDTNIEKFAAWLNKIGSPVFLRIGYECDGKHNSYEPGEYVRAYRYIVDKLRSYNVKNVAFVWHVHAHKLNPDLEAWYPGDKYADWVGLSYFDQPETMMDPVVKFAKARSKPVMIAEGTPRGFGSCGGKESWEGWYGNFLSFVDKNGIKAISYINCNWENQEMWKGQGWKDARVEADDFVLKKWISEMKKDKYLKYSPDSYTAINAGR